MIVSETTATVVCPDWVIPLDPVSAKPLEEFTVAVPEVLLNVGVPPDVSVVVFPDTQYTVCS